jgi:hypothetical protein
MICRGGQIVDIADIADDEALRPDEGIEPTVGAVGLISLQYPCVKQ